MSDRKGTCVLRVQNNVDFSAKLVLNKKYKYTIMDIPGGNIGYVVTNDLDPGNPIKLKKETFMLYFELVPENVGTAPLANSESAMTPNKEFDTPQKKVTIVTPKTSISGPKPNLNVASEESKSSDGLKNVNLFLGLSALKKNLQLFRSITFVPASPDKLTVTFLLPGDIATQVTGTVDDLLQELPAFIDKLVGIENLIGMLSETINKRIAAEEILIKEKQISAENEKKEREATKKEKEDSKKTASKPASKTPAAAAPSLFEQKPENIKVNKIDTAETDEQDDYGANEDAANEESANENDANSLEQWS